MGHTNPKKITEHLVVTDNTTITGQARDGVTIESGVRAEIRGQVVGPIILRKGSRLLISGQAVGSLQIDAEAELTLTGMYEGSLPESFDGVLLAAQGSIINRKVLLDGRFEALQDGAKVSGDAARLFRLTGSDGSLARGEF